MIEAAGWHAVGQTLAAVWADAGAPVAEGSGDPAAAIVGRALSPTGGRKTWAGSIACAVCSAIGVWWLTSATPMAALAVGALAAVVERPTRPLDDNVRVTAATGLLSLWLS